jgi:hypothetical protein
MYMWVAEFIDAFCIIRGLLLLLLVVEHPRSGVVCELAQEVLGFVSGAWGFVVGVRVRCWIVFHGCSC